MFEGEGYDGEIFKLEDHTERLFYSAKEWVSKFHSQKEINDASKILNIQKVQNGYVRPLIWRGSEMMAISAQKNKITLHCNLGMGLILRSSAKIKRNKIEYI